MKNIKYFIGPMSKNIVDVIKQYSKDTSNNIGLIPSRRQVEYDKGYVNDWSTEDFAKYAGGLFLCRDHAGPDQGLESDNGYKSLSVDCSWFNMIHIDPWKKTQDIEEGINLTIEMIDFCFKINKNILFEVGTEQSIRNFTAKEVEYILDTLKKRSPEDQYNNILYCVIQSGTSLQEIKNTGLYEEGRLKSMLDVVKSRGLLSKEHNGDFLEQDLINEKFALGLDSINIAPEFGQIETNVYLSEILLNKPHLLKDYWEICYNSNRWKKWVSKNFNPIDDKEKLIKICGHYILSKEPFKKNIKAQFPDIDLTIKQKIKERLDKLF